MTSTCSVYLITNKINDKVYVGQTWQTLEKRFWAHCNKHPNRSKIKNAIRKYGREQFRIELLGLTYNQDDADNMESYFIERFNSIESGYNIKEGGSHGKHSQESKQKMSEARKGKSPVNKGISPSLETRLKISKNSANKIILTIEQMTAIIQDNRSFVRIAKDYNCSEAYIRRLYKSYNIKKITKRLPHKKHTEETKNKMRLAQLGKKASQATKDKMSKSHMKKDII